MLLPSEIVEARDIRELITASLARRLTIEPAVRTTSGALNDEKLVAEKQRFSDEPTGTTGPCQLDEADDQMDQKEHRALCTHSRCAAARMFGG